MQQLRAAMKRGKHSASNDDSIREILGGPLSAEELKPPPEYAALKKEVRAKQNEVRNLRKRWWTDHKDLDLLTEKIRHHEHKEEEDTNETAGKSNRNTSKRSAPDGG